MIIARPDVDEDVLFVYFAAYRNTQRKNRLRRIFYQKNEKGDRACKNSSDKRQALNFFLNVTKKSFYLNKDFIPSRIFESFKRKPKKKQIIT